MRKRTKIIATIGPSTSSSRIISTLIKEGTDVFRINLSHTTIEDTSNLINLLKQTSKKLKRPVATMVDLQVQKIRIMSFRSKKFVNLRAGDDFVLDTSLKPDSGTQKTVGLTNKSIIRHLDVGDELLLSDALIKLEVKDISNGKIFCRILRGGKLKPYQGMV